MKQRYIVLTIDTIGDLLKDYIGPDLPKSAEPVRLMIKPTEAGALAIEFEDASIPRGLPPLQVKFELKRVYGV